MNNSNKGIVFPINPLMAEDVAILLKYCTPEGIGRCYELSAKRLRMLIILMYRSGLRISETLDLEFRDILINDHCLKVRHGKGDKQRIVAVDNWAWKELEDWIQERRLLPGKHIFPIVQGPTKGLKPLSDTDVRRQLRKLQKKSNINKRIAPHQFRHGHAVELYREGVDLLVIRSQFVHVRLDTTSIYLRSIDPAELLQPIIKRNPPMIVVT